MRFPDFLRISSRISPGVQEDIYFWDSRYDFFSQFLRFFLGIVIKISFGIFSVNILEGDFGIAVGMALGTPGISLRIFLQTFFNKFVQKFVPEFLSRFFQ